MLENGLVSTNNTLDFRQQSRTSAPRKPFFTMGRNDQFGMKGMLETMLGKAIATETPRHHPRNRENHRQKAHPNLDQMVKNRQEVDEFRTGSNKRRI
jgi:hypothetical protein